MVLNKKLIAGIIFLLILIYKCIPTILIKIAAGKGFQLQFSSWHLNIFSRELVLSNLIIKNKAKDLITISKLKIHPHSFFTKNKWRCSFEVLANKVAIILSTTPKTQIFWQSQYQEYQKELLENQGESPITTSIIVSDGTIVFSKNTFGFDCSYKFAQNPTSFCYLYKLKGYSRSDPENFNLNLSMGFDDDTFWSSDRALANCTLNIKKSYYATVKKENNSLEVCTMIDQEPAINLKSKILEKSFSIKNNLKKNLYLNIAAKKQLPQLANFLKNNKPEPIFGQKLIHHGVFNNKFFLNFDLDTSDLKNPFFNNLLIQSKAGKILALKNFNCHHKKMLQGAFEPELLKYLEKLQAGTSPIKQFFLPNHKWMIWLDQSKLLSKIPFCVKLLFNKQADQNLITQVRGEMQISTKNKTAMLKNCEAEFISGKVNIPKSWYNFESGNCFSKINFNKLLLSLPTSAVETSGDLTFHSNSEHNNLLQGEVYLDRGYILLKKNNNNSNNYQDQISSKKQNLCNLDIKIKTREPVSFQLSGQPFLTEIDLDLKGPLSNSGNISKLNSHGSIKAIGQNIELLGYHFNSINSTLNFKNSSLKDPLLCIDLKTKIKKYNLSFHIFGMINDLVINSSSQPHLTEDQIFSLLLTGIIDKSIGIKYLLPATLAKIGCYINDTKSIGFLKKLASPLPGFKLAPTTDLSSESPLAASVLIDLGENLSATIEKDLNYKTDALRLSLEYLLAENLVFKLNHDFEGLMQGLIEMKIRF